MTFRNKSYKLKANQPLTLKETPSGTSILSLSIVNPSDKETHLQIYDGRTNLSHNLIPANSTFDFNQQFVVSHSLQIETDQDTELRISYTDLATAIKKSEQQIEALQRELAVDKKYLVYRVLNLLFFLPLLIGIGYFSPSMLLFPLFFVFIIIDDRIQEMKKEAYRLLEDMNSLLEM